MSPIWGSQVERSDPFASDLEDLEEEYPELPEQIEQLEETLRLGYDLPHVPLDKDRYPKVYAKRIDYPPKGSAGRGQFLVVYHATDPNPSMTDPYRVFTLLAIAEA